MAGCATSNLPAVDALPIDYRQLARDHVLDKMARLHLLTPAQADEARAEALPGRTPFPALAWQVSGELARAAAVYFWSYYTSLHYTANGLRFVASTDLNVTTIVSGLAILVIAEVFREGTRLHEDQSLTI